MSKRLDLTTALGVSRTLLQKVASDSKNIEGQFGEAYKIYHDLWSVVSGHLSIAVESRHDIAIAVAGFASEVIVGALSLDDAKCIIACTVTEAHAASDENSAEEHEKGIDQLIHASEAEILKAALKVRRAV